MVIQKKKKKKSHHVFTALAAEFVVRAREGRELLVETRELPVELDQLDWNEPAANRADTYSFAFIRLLWFISRFTSTSRFLIWRCRCAKLVAMRSVHVRVAGVNGACAAHCPISTLQLCRARRVARWWRLLDQLVHILLQCQHQLLCLGLRHLHYIKCVSRTAGLKGDCACFLLPVLHPSHAVRYCLSCSTGPTCATALESHTAAPKPKNSHLCVTDLRDG